MTYKLLSLFHDNPGSWERHLLRKFRNPLFSDGFDITEETILKAQARDQAEEEAFNLAFQSTLTKALSLPPNAPSESVLALKEGIEKLYEQASGLGGDPSEKQLALLKLNHVIMKTIRTSAGQDGFALSQLDQENIARQRHFELLKFPVVVDLLREDSPILSTELTAVFLVESKDSLAALLTLFDLPQITEIHEQGKILLASLEERNIEIPFADERLEEIGQHTEVMATS